MSKRSGLPRWQDLRRNWFIDIGRYRWMLHKFDMEPWREKICPICELGFDKEPNYYTSIYPVHNDCAFTPAYDKWAQETFDDDYVEAESYFGPTYR